MKKENKSVFFIILALLFIIGIFFDKNITNFFYTHQNIYISSILNFICSYFLIVPLLIIIFILFSFKSKKNIIKLPLSVFLTIIFVYLLKFIIDKERPFSNELNSFPSFHSALVFSIFPFFKNKYKISWLIFSILVCFSRIYLGKHFLTDVIAGIFIGYVIGFFTDKFVEKRL
jgi:membrane-associated phospholipid phosphatase